MVILDHYRLLLLLDLFFFLLSFSFTALCLASIASFEFGFGSFVPLVPFVSGKIGILCSSRCGGLGSGGSLLRLELLFCRCWGKKLHRDVP